MRMLAVAALGLLSIGFDSSVLFAQPRAAAAAKITTPKEQFGSHLGDDYFLATYTQLTEYWQKLAKESDRMKLVEIGKSEEGRPQWMAIVTSPENHRKLGRYKEIARKLALAEGLTDDEAKKLAAEGKAVVWIDGGLHASEVLGAQQLMESLYTFLSRTDAETMRILESTIILFVQANPDGQEMVTKSYMSEKEPTKRVYVATALYQKYVGHDNNRDFYMATQSETVNMNRQLYHEWFPQIMYNHHQTGPLGTVLFVPPFRDPASYWFDPLVMLGIDQVGSAIQSRFLVEGKAGAATRGGASYSVWYNGGLRTTTDFHNMIGILTETIGNPTPMEIPFVPERQLSSETLRMPIAPQKWHFRQSIEYSLTANYAVLDLASRTKDQLLFNMYRMGKNSMEKGSRDTWTITPSKMAAVEAVIAKERPAADAARGGRGGLNGPPSMNADAADVFGRGQRGVDPKYWAMLHKPEDRDPRGFIIPANQPDFLTATKFVNTLIKGGIAIHRATAEFSVAGKQYPVGSYVVKAAQAFRPHLMDLFEPQDHPNDFAYPGGPPRPPYDNAGWTLTYQMAVKFDRILDEFSGPFEKIEGFAKTPTGGVKGSGAGYLLSHRVNDSFIAVNRLLKAGEEVYWLKKPVATGMTAGEYGTMYIPAKASTKGVLDKLAADKGLVFEAVAAKPEGEAIKLKPVRIGLWDEVGGSMPSGWTRWIFEQFEFPYEVVYPPTLDAGDLGSKFDVLVFVTGGIPDGQVGRGEGGGGFGPRGPLPVEWQPRAGRVSVDKTVPQLKKFLETGGTILTVGSSTALARQIGLPVMDALVERTAAGTERHLPREKFYVPGSVMRVAVDNTNPLAWGMEKDVDVFFNNSPVFRFGPDAQQKKVSAVAWFDSPKALRSGWAWGQQYLDGGVAVAEASVGEGKLFLFGPEITNRAQPHGTFKLLFNAIYYGSAGK